MDFYRNFYLDIVYFALRNLELPEEMEYGAEFYK